MTTAEDWLAEVAPGVSENEVARRVGLVQSTLSRQLRADAVPPENVVAIAREYGASPVSGLVAIGLIAEDEVRRAAGMVGIEDVTDEDLVAEVLRRIQTASAHPDLIAPVASIEIARGEHDPQRRAARRTDVPKDDDPTV